MNSTNETLLFDRFLIMYNLCVFTCIIFIIVFHCTHVRMSYVLNSYLLTYLLSSNSSMTVVATAVAVSGVLLKMKVGIHCKCRSSSSSSSSKQDNQDVYSAISVTNSLQELTQFTKLIANRNTVRIRLMLELHLGLSSQALNHADSTHQILVHGR